MFKSQKTSVGYTSLQSLLIANLFPLFSVLWFNGSLSLILEFYVVESIVIGFMVLIRVLLGPNLSLGGIAANAFLFLFFFLILGLIAIAITSYFPKEDVATPTFWSIILFFVGLIAIQAKQIIQDYLAGNLQESDTSLHIFEIHSRLIFIICIQFTLAEMKELYPTNITLSIFIIFALKFIFELIFYANNYVNAKFST